MSDDAAARLTAHLGATYGIRVAALTELDAGVFRVDRHDGPGWVARVFPVTRPVEHVDGDAKVLDALRQAGFPAERCARPEPVSTLDGQGVLVTEFVPGSRPDRGPRTFAVLGSLLGRLHTRSGETFRAGGAWHRVSPVGGPREEIAATLALLDEARQRVPAADLSRYDTLRDRIERADDCADLPHAFVHPDFVPANAIATDDGHLVIVDWTGAGRGPRVWSLGFLLWAAGVRDLRLVDTVITRYRTHIQLTRAELARLAGAISARPLVIDAWSLATGRKQLSEVIKDMSATERLADTIAERVRRAVEERPVEPVDAPLPLSALLSQALVAYTVEFDNEFEHRMPHRTTRHGSTGERRQVPWLVSMAMWCNCMRYVDTGGVTVAELARLARTTTNLPGMVRWGYVEAEPKQLGPTAVLRATEAGERAREVWRPLFDTIDARWRERFGEDAIGSLRDALIAVAGRLGAGLPDCLPILGHGLFSAAPPTSTAPAEDVTGLPLVVLLARVLLAFAVEFERESVLSLAIRANVLRVLDEDGVLVRDIPPLTGVSREAVDMATGYLATHGYAVVEPVPAPGRGRRVRLTAAGLAARRATPVLLADIEEGWHTRFGADAVAALRAALAPLVGEPLFAGLVPYPGGWRASVKRPALLPHYPMVLHRGGFPDGS